MQANNADGSPTRERPVFLCTYVKGFNFSSSTIHSASIFSKLWRHRSPVTAESRIIADQGGGKHFAIKGVHGCFGMTDQKWSAA